MKKVFRFIWALTKFIFIGDTVDAHAYNLRLDKCYSCKHLLDNKCGVCGCYVKKKAKWSTESCPKNKW